MENEKAIYFLMIMLNANGGSIKISLEDAEKLMARKEPLRIVQKKNDSGVELVLEPCHCPAHSDERGSVSV